MGTWALVLAKTVFSTVSERMTRSFSSISAAVLLPAAMAAMFMTAQVALLILPVFLTQAVTAFPVVMHPLRLPSCRIHPAINMYTVKKISEEPPSVDTAVMMQADADNGLDRVGYNTGNRYDSHSLYRRRMILDHGMNANYQRPAILGTKDL